MCQNATGLCVIDSTPHYTHRAEDYEPRVFGVAFHREVGHVVDGYRLAALDRLLPAPYERVAYQYN